METKEKEEKPSTKITFKNQPVMSKHEVDMKFNERRNYLVKAVEDFMSSHNRFKGKEVTITFAEKGISSLVCIIDDLKEKYVLKIPLSVNYAEGEHEFLKKWEEVGVKVPHVFEAGKLAGHSYSLMEYIDAPVLGDKYSTHDLVDNGTILRMGKTLRQMHTAKGEGYGRLVGGKGECKEFKNWIQDKEMTNRLERIRKYKLVDDLDENWSAVCDILVKYISEQNNSSYCHWDFQVHNLFDTEPLTVFDPNPRMNEPYLDLGRSLQNLIGKGVKYDEFLKGYFGNEPYNKEVLLASIFFSIYWKFPYAYETKRDESIMNKKKFLEENRNFWKK
jgi:fructosamine-3-kinase